MTAGAVDSRFRATDEVARSLVRSFGTPLYVVDEASFLHRIRRYREAFSSAYADSEISFASKANSTVALLAIAYREGCGIDVASEGELRAALAAGVPASTCHFHGNNKSIEELTFALETGVNRIVADSFHEIELLGKLLTNRSYSPEVVLRLAPGVDPATHRKISTGQADTKFGFNITDGSAEQALQKCIAKGMNVSGFHCHVGSQLLDASAHTAAAEIIAQFAVEMLKQLGFETRYLNVGGGLGVRYRQDSPLSIERHCIEIVRAMEAALQASGLHPRLGQEPGRSLIAEAGTTIYTVGVVKSVPSPTKGVRTYAGVDGGLSDNPRPAMYDASYDVELVGRRSTARHKAFTVSGKHCETDLLFEDAELPEDLSAGDLLQVLCTGAYNSSMASNYNRFRRPPTALIRRNGQVDLIQRSETWDEMLQRDLLPADLKPQ